jgi:hypothetical protein
MEILAREAGLEIKLRRPTSNLSQFTASERYFRDIPMSDPRRDRELFTRGELADWSRRAKKLEAEDLADQVIYVLGRS